MHSVFVIIYLIFIASNAEMFQFVTSYDYSALGDVFQNSSDISEKWNERCLT